MADNVDIKLRRICMNCHYSERQGVCNHFGGGGYLCKFNPPVWNGITHEHPNAVFPSVNGTDWCGKYDSMQNYLEETDK
jgi:hypothetical protein